MSISDPQPWAMPEYHASKPRVLVVGSSHHGKPDERTGSSFTEFTKRVVGQRIDGAHGRFFAMPEGVLAEDREGLGSNERDVQARRTFWSETAFINYVQEVLDTPRAGTWNEMDPSYPRAKSAIAALDPNLVFFFAARAFDNFVSNVQRASDGELTEGPDIADMRVVIWRHHPSSAPIVIARLRHPRGSGLRWEEWRKRADALKGWWRDAERQMN